MCKGAALLIDAQKPPVHSRHLGDFNLIQMADEQGTNLPFDRPW